MCVFFWSTCDKHQQSSSSFKLFFRQKISIIIQVAVFFSFVFSGFVLHIIEIICLADAPSLLMKISHHCMLQFLNAPNILRGTVLQLRDCHKNISLLWSKVRVCLCMHTPNGKCIMRCVGFVVVFFWHVLSFQVGNCFFFLFFRGI